jgi:putative copper export protein
MTLYHFVVTVHVLAAVLWLGGMFFIAIVGAPVLRRLEPVTRAELFRQLGERFRRAGWVAIAVLLITGLANLAFRGVLTLDALGDGAFWRTKYGSALAWKLGAVAVMLNIQAWHDFVLGPRAGRLTPGSPEALRTRRQAAWLARISAVVALVLVWAAVRLARGG